MPPRPKSAFLCQQCGFQSPKWVGRCPSCEGWNTLVEERIVAAPKGRGIARAPRVPIALGDVPAATAILDRFLQQAEVIPITGRSYRLRNQKDNSGLAAGKKR